MTSFKSALKYVLRGKTHLYIHSPFVYQICQEVLYDKRKYYAFDAIAYVRKLYLDNPKTLAIKDFGAGSRQNKQTDLRIKDICKRAALPTSYGKLLFRLGLFMQSKYRLELGTSLGIGSLYQFMHDTRYPMISIEGSEALAQQAQSTFSKMYLNHLQCWQGTFEILLPKAIATLPQLDWVFFDGNHRLEPTLRYFEQCLPKVHEDTVFIFDDIHWSAEMEQAWEAIKARPEVSISIDLYRMGLVFFRKNIAKEDFTLYYW
ncbi:MAG: class I SAM-dependent methyltransferase [Chitinophagales bacterium]|nr:class I SAM-dependent methyltransferase [Bacteroidota bacterium]MCB9042968.1 class I SAM-dependent methyltransferase [Chitinophagales bacterium]